MLQRLNGWKKIIALVAYLYGATHGVPMEALYGLLGYMGAQGLADFGKHAKE